jgi:hypothetical protein
MANSFVTYTGDGTTLNFVVPFPYIEQSHIRVTVGGEITEVTWNDPGTVVVTPAAPSGAAVRVARVTPSDASLVDFADDSVLDAALLDLMNTQLFYLAQEAVDRAYEKAVEYNNLALSNSPVPYNAGLVFTNYNQTFVYHGELYAAPEGMSLPYTTTGSGAAEIATFRSVGDAVLRGDLASASDPAKGAGAVAFSEANAYGAGTVGSSIKSTQQDILALENADTPARVSKVEQLSASQFSASLSPIVVDMHYGTLLGAGWTASEPPFSVTGYSLTVSSAVSVGATTIPVSNTSNFAAGMLIAYVATDGLYYAARINAILAGPVLQLDRQTLMPIAAGGLVWNVYRDDAHPNANGAHLVVDDALRQISAKRLRALEWRGNDGSIWRPVNGTTLSSVTSADYNNPGTVTVGERPSLVTGANPGQGVISVPVTLVGGDYVAKVQVNIGTRTGGFSGAVDVSIQETRADGTTFGISVSENIGGYAGNKSVELHFSSTPGSTISVLITSQNSGGWTFTAGQIEYHKLSGQALPLDRGKHVLFGDSWFVSGGAIHNSMIARLPNSEVLSAGIVGNKASQMLARFGADVAPLSPDYVWVMVGTNDYYAGVTPALFEQQILQLRRLIQGIGAQAIFFTPSVGAVTYTPQQLHPSRRYALNVNYGEVAPSASAMGAVQRGGIASIQGLSVAAGATVTAFVFPAQTRKSAWLRMLAVNTAGVNVRFEYCSAADGAGGVEPTIFNTAAAVRDVALPRVSDTALRMLCVRINNPTGSPVSVSFTADVTWVQDLV